VAGAPPTRPTLVTRGRTAAALVVAGLSALVLLGTGCGRAGDRVDRAEPTALVAPSLVGAGPLDLGQREVDLRAGPVVEPITLEVPALDLVADILGVGMTTRDVMDAPSGDHDSPVWQQAFWYRGSAVPGQASTALIAGHVNNQLDEPGVFARLDELAVGDEVIVRDHRDGSAVTFSVVDTHSYTLAEAATPEVLRIMYGSGPVDGAWPTPSADGLAHLTLVTCAGTYVDGTHDHRLVVQAVRSPNT
jgi:hypothetical protein